MLDRMYRNEEEYDDSQECDYFERYSFEDCLTDTGVILDSGVVDFLSRCLRHWYGDIMYVCDKDGYITGYEYWTYEEDELWQSNEIRRDITYLLEQYRRFH